MSKETEVTNEEQKSGAEIRMNELSGFLIRRMHQIAIGLFIDEIKGYNVTTQQFMVLQQLREVGEVDQITLAGLIGMNRTTISDVVSRLDNQGYLQRFQSVRDRRIKLMRITVAGIALLDEIGPKVLEAQRRMMAPLSEEEQKIFVQLLGRLVDVNNEWSRAPLTV